MAANALRICSRRSASQTPASLRSDPVQSSARAWFERTAAIAASTTAAATPAPTRIRLRCCEGSRERAKSSSRIDPKRFSGSAERARATIRWTQTGTGLEDGGGSTLPCCAFFSRSALDDPANGSRP